MANKQSSTHTIREGIEYKESGKGIEAPDAITPNVSTARTIYDTYRRAHLSRISLYAQMEGLFRGHPPYSPSELKSAGLQHISNFNDMSGRALIKRSSQAYWNLLHNSRYLINITLHMPEVPEAAIWGRRMSKNWDYVIKKRWKGFLPNVAALSTQLVKFGVSPAIFPDENSFKWKAVELNKFYIPDNTSTDLDLLTSFAIESEFTFQYLWEAYKYTKKNPKSSPWQIDTLESFLVSYSSSYLSSGNSQVTVDMKQLEDMVLSGDSSIMSHFSDVVVLVSFYQKEYSGKFSHYMFTTNSYGAPQSKETSEEGFLYKLEDQYDSLDQVLVLFTINPGEFRVYHSIGVGHEGYSLIQAGIMLGCSTVDMAKWASTPIVKSSSLGTKDQGIVKFFPGVATDIGTLEFVQNNLGANVQNVVSVSDYIRKQIQYNLTFSGSDVASPDPSQGSLTPSQVKLQAMNEFSVLKNAIMHFYSVFDSLLENMVIRMLHNKDKSSPEYKIIKEWKAMCVRDGVPEAIFDIPDDVEGLPMHIEVAATRAAGAGSQVAQLMGLEAVKSVAGSFGPKAEDLFIEQTVSAALGPEYVEGYMADRQSPDEISGGASLAGLENALMEMGKQPTFSKDNEQRSHIAVHLQLGNKLIQASQQQQIDPIQASMVLDQLIPHMRLHMQEVANNPMAQSFLNKIKQPYDQIVAYANLIKKNAVKMEQARIKKQQEEAQKQQQAMTDEQRKDYVTQKEEQRKDFKLQEQNRRQQEQHDVKRDMLKEKTQSDIDLARQKASSERSLNERKVENERAVKEQQISNDSDIERIKANLESRTKDAEVNPENYLKELNGNTPAPADYE